MSRSAETVSVSLNIDLGELPSEPEELYELATIVNIACGGHAGDRATMKRACSLAQASGARLSAHPAYPDRAHFGRRSLPMDTAELELSLNRQMSDLWEQAEGVGLAIDFIKPHGALYHDAERSAEHAAALFAVTTSLAERKGEPIALIGPGQGKLFEMALRSGHPYFREGFADRGLALDGRLIARDQPGALLESPEAAAEQALLLAESGTVETICVHGDTKGALAIARAVRQALLARGLLL